MTSFASTVLRVLNAEASCDQAPHAKLAYDLLIVGHDLISHRPLDVLATECLFVARLDGGKTIDEAYEQLSKELLVPVRSQILTAEDPLAELEAKIARLKRAVQYNFRTDTEALIRGLVNQIRKAFPGFGIKAEVQHGRLTITSDLVVRNCGLAVTFGSAARHEYGEMLVKVEEGLADWAWTQTDRLHNMNVTIVRRGETYVPRKSRIKALRRKNQARYEAMSMSELQQAA